MAVRQLQKHTHGLTTKVLFAKEHQFAVAAYLVTEVGAAAMGARG